MTTKPIKRPWMAYTRVQWEKNGLAGMQHGTTNGKTSLCGIKKLGGCDPDSEFTDTWLFSCRKCVTALNKIGLGVEGWLCHCDKYHPLTEKWCPICQHRLISPHRKTPPFSWFDPASQHPHPTAP